MLQSSVKTPFIRAVAFGCKLLATGLLAQGIVAYPAKHLVTSDEVCYFSINAF